MNAEQFQKAVGTRLSNVDKLSKEDKANLVGAILTDMAALGEAAAMRYHYLWKGYDETDNMQVTEDVCMVLTCIAEYCTTKGYKLEDLMRKAFHIRSQYNNDLMGGN